MSFYNSGSTRAGVTISGSWLERFDCNFPYAKLNNTDKNDTVNVRSVSFDIQNFASESVVFVGMNSADSYSPNTDQLNIYLDSGSNRIIFSTLRNGVLNEVTSSTNTFITGVKYHIDAIIAREEKRLYIDGTLDASSSYTMNYFTMKNIRIGQGAGWITSSMLTTFDIDEVRVYNRIVSGSESIYLSNHPSGEGYVGNIFYGQGILTITNQEPRYQNVLLGTVNDGFVIGYRSTQTIYEHSYLCIAKENEFNVTMNPTVRLNNDPGIEVPKGYVTSSEFSPYISTIGLYNDHNELLVIAKPARPVKKDNDLSLTFNIQLDF